MKDDTGSDEEAENDVDEASIVTYQEEAEENNEDEEASYETDESCATSSTSTDSDILRILEDVNPNIEPTRSATASNTKRRYPNNEIPTPRRRSVQTPRNTTESAYKACDSNSGTPVSKRRRKEQEPVSTTSKNPLWWLRDEALSCYLPSWLNSSPLPTPIKNRYTIDLTTEEPESAPTTYTVNPKHTIDFITNSEDVSHGEATSNSERKNQLPQRYVVLKS